MRLRHAKMTVVLLSIAGLAALAAITAFLFVPSFKDVVHLSEQIDQAHAELDAQYANRKNLLSSLTKAQQARADMQTLSAEFVPEGRELDFITSVEALAAKDGVEEHVSLSPNESGKTADELKEGFELTITGPYRSVMQMLVDLEKMPTLLLDNSVQVRPGQGTNPGDQSFLSLDVRGLLATPPKGL